MSDIGPTDDLGRPLTQWGVLALVALVTRDELGVQCASNECCGVARWLVPWPGREATRQCQGHYEHTLAIARVFGMDDLIRLGSRQLEVVRRELEPEDPTAARFAAMELT